MKKQIITIALLISSLVGFSNTEINKKVTVEFKNVKKGHSLTIKDENGTELYSETMLENGNLSKILDVTSLDEGNYVIEMDKDYEMVSKIEFDQEPTQIVIYFENEVIFSETIKNETLLNRVYKLDAEKKGSYKVFVYSQDRKYSNTFKI